MIENTSNTVHDHVHNKRDEVYFEEKDRSKLREALSGLRAELVVLQRTEQVLKSRHKNLDQFLEDLERRKGVEGYRETQRALVEMSEKAAEVDQLKGATLEEISTMVEQIGREFRQKQAQLQPLMARLKSVRQEYMEVQSDYQEKKGSFEKVAVGLDMEKGSLERECDSLQVMTSPLDMISMILRCVSPSFDSSLCAENYAASYYSCEVSLHRDSQTLRSDTGATVRSPCVYMYMCMATSFFHLITCPTPKPPWLPGLQDFFFFGVSSSSCTLHPHRSPPTLLRDIL